MSDLEGFSDRHTDRPPSIAIFRIVQHIAFNFEAKILPFDTKDMR